LTGAHHGLPAVWAAVMARRAIRDRRPPRRGRMGEVYRPATFARARGPVKILPASLAGDEERLLRSSRRRRRPGPSNHPSVLVVHDVGTHEGTPTSSRSSSRARPPRAALFRRPARRRALAIATDRGAARRGARWGIVHRDLKPENVFLIPRRRARSWTSASRRSPAPWASTPRPTRSTAAPPRDDAGDAARHGRLHVAEQSVGTRPTGGATSSRWASSSTRWCGGAAPSRAHAGRGDSAILPTTRWPCPPPTCSAVGRPGRRALPGEGPRRALPLRPELASLSRPWGRHGEQRRVRRARSGRVSVRPPGARADSPPSRAASPSSLRCPRHPPRGRLLGPAPTPPHHGLPAHSSRAAAGPAGWATDGSALLRVPRGAAEVWQAPLGGGEPRAPGRALQQALVRTASPSTPAILVIGWNGGLTENEQRDLPLWIVPVRRGRDAHGLRVHADPWSPDGGASTALPEGARNDYGTKLPGAVFVARGGRLLGPEIYRGEARPSGSGGSPRRPAAALRASSTPPRPNGGASRWRGRQLPPGARGPAGSTGRGRADGERFVFGSGVARAEAGAIAGPRFDLHTAPGPRRVARATRARH